MQRTEIIPQTTAKINTGHLYYHFSLKISSTNTPNFNYEVNLGYRIWEMSLRLMPSRL
jgi:hypothetical protein